MEDCKHYFRWGYTLEPVVYCGKCDKEIDELGIPFSILSNHDVIDGKFVWKYKAIYPKNLWHLIKLFLKNDGLFYLPHNHNINK